jgi:hypothetical protein
MMPAAIRSTRLRTILGGLAILLAAGSQGAGQAQVEKAHPQTDPNSPELRALAQPAVIDQSPYGCGPLGEPGRTYYVSQRGDDQADGSSWAAAWRHVHYGIARLQAGDTLVIGEGVYVEPPMAMNVKQPQTGLPGRPITIQAAPRQRVMITGARPLELTRAPGTQWTWQAACTLDKGRGAAWETDTQILLQQNGQLEAVEEFPGTWCYDATQELLYAHFSDSRGPDVHGLAVCPGKTSVSNFSNSDSCGLDIRASHVRVQGIWFSNFHTGVVIQGNTVKKADGTTAYRGGDHVTIEDCWFSSSCFAGLVLCQNLSLG